MTTRVFVPATLPLLREILASGAVAAPATAYAVTPALRESYFSGDDEELEYAAFIDAARASLRLLAADPAAPRRRVVLALDVAEAALTPASGDEPAAVRLTEPARLRAVASGHVDDTDASDDVAAAVAALPAAGSGDPDAQFTVDGAEGHELMWFARQELAELAGPAQPGDQ